jgi:hypothetical protein
VERKFLMELEYRFYSMVYCANPSTHSSQQSAADSQPSQEGKLQPPGMPRAEYSHGYNKKKKTQPNCTQEQEEEKAEEDHHPRRKTSSRNDNMKKTSSTKRVNIVTNNPDYFIPRSPVPTKLQEV